MNFLRTVLKREAAVPTLTLAFTSAASVALVLARIVWTGKIHYGFLIWNLFLAWMPLIFALLAWRQYAFQVITNKPTPSPSEEGSIVKRAPHAVPLLGGVRGGFTSGQNWRFYGLAGAWLLFFPNAPYIFTDLIHLTTVFYRHFWIDLMLILLCAFTGLVLGFVSLYLMQSVVARMYGRVAGWLFVAMSAGLCSFGIYLGRFLRFNSWDVVFQPHKIYRGIDAWMDGRVPHMSSGAFLVLFATFLFLSYVMLYALTHLPRSQEFHSQSGHFSKP